MFVSLIIIIPKKKTKTTTTKNPQVVSRKSFTYEKRADEPSQILLQLLQLLTFWKTITKQEKTSVAHKLQLNAHRKIFI